MTKAELVASIAMEAKLPQVSAEKTLNAFTSTVTKALKKGDKLTLTGFGTFSVARGGPRQGEIPRLERRLRFPLQG